MGTASSMAVVQVSFASVMACNCGGRGWQIGQGSVTDRDLENGGTMENVQAIAARETPRKTKRYDRRSDAISLDEIERVII
jgi:hypothetical protein